MQDSQYQSNALDQYLDALLRDPDTPAPHELDSETVALVKALVENKTSQKVDERVKDRVWSRVLFATYAPPQLKPTYSPPVVVALPKKQRTDVAFLVAAVLAVICLSGFFIQYTDTARDSVSGKMEQGQITRTLPRERFMPAMQQDWQRRAMAQEGIVLLRYTTQHRAE